MLLHIKYLVYTTTTAGVAGGGRGGDCNLHSCFLPRQPAAFQPLGKLPNLGLARVWLQGWSRASPPYLCHSLPLCCRPVRAGCSAALKSAQGFFARC